MNNKILVVEDDVMLYDQLKAYLTQWGFDVLPYTPSYEDAKKMLAERPAVVLLDIHLQGEKTGYDVARYIDRTEPVPFIYLTAHSDDMHFMQAAGTGPVNFIDKMDILSNPDLLKRQLLLLIRKAEKETPVREKPLIRGLRGYKTYLSELKNSGREALAEHNVDVDKIMYISTDRDLAKIFGLDLRTNYSFFVTEDGAYYLTAKSLSDLNAHLPENFVRINDKMIINLLSKSFIGLNNKSNIKIKDKIFHISKTYIHSFYRLYDKYYIPPKKRKN